ncbi:MAG: hypothetical protein IGS50_16665 [Synechococcales cyanobacterium C42_A2020_086]|jgi:hypothetical protein|nr:hypothetical protein [Synechococcales cyanobacterium M58_A2018_015]MBF2075375.1 hypothetical protein [Synechococcales cyanobacterium C42_A2020_086]
MFMDELTPVFKQLTTYPVAFLGGFVSGLLRLNLADDPVKSWLDQQSGSYAASTASMGSTNGKSSGPKSIAIE